MTNTTGGTTPAGWYPVSPGSSELRWWDGAAWTEHRHDQAVQQPVGGGIPKAPAGTNPNTVWIWILACLPLLGLVSLFTINLGSYMHSIIASSGDFQATQAAEQALLTSPGYLLTLVIGLVQYAVIVVLAFLDWRRLSGLGVPKPFHWALSFIPGGYGYIVYMIGRFVIVRRRTGKGLAPMWLWIALAVAIVIIAFIWVISLTASAVSQFPTS